MLSLLFDFLKYSLGIEFFIYLLPAKKRESSVNTVQVDIHRLFKEFSSIHVINMTRVLECSSIPFRMELRSVQIFLMKGKNITTDFALRHIAPLVIS